MGSNINCQAACGLASVEVVNATDLYGTLEERTATITVTAPGGAAKIYTIIFYSPSTQLANIEISNQPQIIRNPFSGALQIRNWEQFEKLDVYDLSGKAMGSYRINNTSISQTTDLLEGVYIMKIYNREGEVYVRKVVKYKN